MKRLLFTLCTLAATALQSFAQNPIDNAQLYLTDNQVTNGAVLTVMSGGTITAQSGAAVDLHLATVTFADAQIPVAKVNGALSTATAAATYQPLDSDLTSIAALTTTTFGRSLLTQADAAATRTTLGLGTAATTASTAYATAAQGTKADNAGAVNGLLKSNGSASFSAATSGTDYVIPSGSVATLTTGRTLGITGDLVWTSPSFNGSANVTAAGTLATVNSNVGTFGSATQSLTATVNAKGLVTAMSAQTVTPAWTSVTGKPTTVATSGLTDAVSTAALNAKVDPVAAARASRQSATISYNYDGQVYTLRPTKDVILGSAPYSVGGWVYFDSFLPPNNYYLFLTISSFGFFVNNDGSNFSIEGAAQTSTKGLTAKRWHHVMAVRSNTASNGVTYYLDGVACGTTTDANNYTPAVASAGNGSGTSGWRISPHILNRALSSTEVAKIWETGAVDPYDARGFGGIELIVGDSSNFAGGVGGWGNYYGSPTITGGSGSMTITAASPGAASVSAALSPDFLKISKKPGLRFRYEIVVTAITGSWGFSKENNGSPPFMTAPGTYVYEADVTNPNGWWLITLGPQTTGSITITKAKITVLGGVLVPSEQQQGAGYLWCGAGGRDLILTEYNVGWNLPASGGIQTVRGSLSWSGTHEAKSLLGQIALPSNARITNITTSATTASSGSGLTLGTTNSATRWVALNTYSTGTKIHTVANSGLPAGTAAADLDIILDPDTANYTGTINVSVDYTFTN
jgi:hypothetical protein